MQTNLLFGAVAGFVVSIVIGASASLDMISAVGIGASVGAVVSGLYWMTRRKHT